MFGPGIDEAVLWYEGTGTGTKRFLDQNEQGSVVRINDGSGNAIAVNTYDEYGRPGAANQGRFQYTGQAWIADVGLSYYKARMYAPTLGRFMQTDPIGYGDGVNWYNYAHSNPVNGTDSSGKACTNLNKKARVLSGCFNPDTAGDGGSYLGGSVLGDNAFLNYASGVDNAYYAQQAAAQRAGSVYIESVADAGSSSAASDGTAQNKQLQGACSECMLLLLVGGEAIEAGKLFQAGYDALTELIAGAAAPEGAATVEDVISPGGSLIGTPNPGSPGDVQNLPGGDQAANDLFDKLSKFGTPGNKTGYPGPTVDLPNGGFAGYRSGAGSSSGVPAVDVNIPGTYVGKFHFP